MNLRAFANGKACARCYKQDGTIVLAHYCGPRQHAFGKGAGIKVNDIFGAHLCSECHTHFDQYKDGKHRGAFGRVSIPVPANGAASCGGFDMSSDPFSRLRPITRSPNWRQAQALVGSLTESSGAICKHCYRPREDHHQFDPIPIEPEGER